MFAAQAICLLAPRALANAGSRMAMMDITTSNSIKVKAVAGHFFAMGRSPGYPTNTQPSAAGQRIKIGTGGD
jgi:hypothetical protein